MIHGTQNIVVCLPQAMGVMNVLGAIVTTESGSEIGIVTDEGMIEETTGHVIADPQKIVADPIACSGISKGTTIPTQGKSHAGKTDIKSKGVARTHHEEMIGDTTHKGHHRHRAMMRPEAIKQKCRSTNCLRKLSVTCNVVTLD